MGFESLQREAVRTRTLREGHTAILRQAFCAFRNEYACISRELSINIQFRIDRVNGSDSLIGKYPEVYEKFWRLSAVHSRFRLPVQWNVELRPESGIHARLNTFMMQDHARNLAIEYLNTISKMRPSFSAVIQPANPYCHANHSRAQSRRD